MQELCHVAVEKPPKDSGGGRVKESKRNRTDPALQVRLNFCVDHGKTKRPPLMTTTNPMTLGFLSKIPHL